MSEVRGQRPGNGARAPIRSFRDLEVFKRSRAVLKPLHELVLTFPRYETHDLADQLRRASKSIPATIAEGYARKDSAKEFRRYLRIAMGSSTEIEVHFDIAHELGYITTQQYEYFIGEYQAVTRMLYRLIEAWRKIETSDLQPLTSDLGEDI